MTFYFFMMPSFVNVFYFIAVVVQAVHFRTYTYDSRGTSGGGLLKLLYGKGSPVLLYIHELYGEGITKYMALLLYVYLGDLRGGLRYVGALG